ncbi:MAG: serine hydrolase domain-containing protein, partial [Stackebrandtia sp.]
IGSITKTFTAVLVMRLRDEGLLDLSDPLEAHVSGTPFGDRTIAALLSHTGGLAAEPPGSWWERSPGVEAARLREGLDDEALRHRSGRRFHYSNLAYAMLGQVVAARRGCDWTRALRQEILRPLELDRTTVLAKAPHADGFAVHPYADVTMPEPAHDSKAMGPAGQLWSTAADLGRWARFLVGEGGDVLCGDTLAEMREPQVVDDGAAWTGGFGLGLQLLRRDGRRVFGHSGSMPGFQAGLWIDEDSRDAAAAFMNCTTTTVKGVALEVLDAVVAREPRPVREWAPRESVEESLLELTGLWHWGTSSALLRVLGDGQLRLEPLEGMLSRSRFRPEGHDRWIGVDGYHAGEVMRVERDAAGRPERLNLHTFVLTREPYRPIEAIPGGVDEGWPAV